MLTAQCLWHCSVTHAENLRRPLANSKVSSGFLRWGFDTAGCTVTGPPRLTRGGAHWANYTISSVKDSEALNDEGASCQELLPRSMKKTGSMKTVFMEVRVKITQQIVVGANCLSSSLIRSYGWWRCQLSRTITWDYVEDWKHEDGVHGSKGQYDPYNSCWCKLPEFISYKEPWMMKVPAVKNYYSGLWRRLEAWRQCSWK